MKNQNYRFEIPIREQIKKLGSQFVEGKSLNIQIKKTEDRLTVLDNYNPEHSSTQHSVHETMRMVMNTIMFVFCYTMDFAVVYNAIALFCPGQLLSLLRGLIPFAFVGAEIWISYMVAEKRNAGEHVSRLEKTLRYLVISFLIGFSVLSVVYSAIGYKPSIDGNTYLLNILYAVLGQLFLLAPAVALHIWIIKHAEEVYMTFARFLFKSTRRKPEWKQKRITVRQDKSNAIFVKNVYVLVGMVERFTAQFGVSANYFAHIMSTDLINAINTVMGRTIFDSMASKEHSYDVQ